MNVKKSKKFSSTPSELNLNCVSTPSELAISNYTTFSSLGVLIKLDTSVIIIIKCVVRQIICFLM